MIEDVITQTLSIIPANVDCICMDDIYHHFCRSQLWSKAAAFKRQTPECLLELKAIVPTSVSTIRQLMELQYKSWQQIASPYLECSSITLYKEASVLRFITARDNKQCFTGRMMVGGDHYFTLVSKRLARLPSAPFPVDLRS